jgi:hypothetical protein
MATYQKKRIVMVLEGETEIVFYSRLLDYLYEHIVTSAWVFRDEIDFILARGVGNIGVRAVQTFKMRYTHASHTEHIVFCCYDTDVFENGRMPRLWTEHTVQKFLDAGAQKVYSICAQHMIEDWYLYDYDGILAYLGLSKKEMPPSASAVPGKNAVKKLNYIYRKSNKIYQKGYATDELISHLDIGKIYSCIQKEIRPLIKELNSKPNKRTT